MPLTRFDYPLRPLGIDRVMAEHWRRPADSPSINLCTGVSAFDPSPFAASGARHRANREYGDPIGKLSLREALSGLLSRTYDVDVPPHRIFITDGATGGLVSALLALVEPGAEVVMPRIFYPSYPVVVRMLGGTPRFADVDENMNVTAETVRAALSPTTRAIILNSPANPFANVLSREELCKIADLGVPILADEVYGWLDSQGPSASILNVEGKGHYVVNSLSKCYAAPGLRVGFLVVPEDAQNLMLTIRTSLNLCCALDSQAAAGELVLAHDAILSEHRKHLSQRRALFLKTCERLGLPLALEPRTGFFGVLKLSARMASSLDVAMDLLRSAGVATAPGADFSTGDPRFLRINYTGDSDELVEGLERIQRYLGKSA